MTTVDNDAMFAADVAEYASKQTYSFGLWTVELIRNVDGIWCGYVCVPDGIPDWFCEDMLAKVPHGGITFRSLNKVGFHCGHPSIDYVPQSKVGAMYRNHDFALAECFKLATELQRVIGNQKNQVL
jgi:hypothetical protein